jgi:hypothetical protein
MPARRKAPPRSRLNQAVKAGRKAIRQAEKRIPPDLRRQIERGIKDGQTRFDATVKDIRARVSKATAPGEMERALKRFSGLSKQVEGLARKLTARAAAATRGTATRRTTTRRTTTRRAATTKRKPAAPKPAATKPAARKPAARRSPRRRAAPAVVTPPPAVPEAPGSEEA